jgi:hypothetical protein
MTVILPTAYFPSLNYFTEAIKADEIVIEAFETYIKQTCRNHCTIVGPNGIQKLIVPVKKPDGNHTITRDVLISDHQPWQKIHWRSIETAYSNSPFFLYYQDQFSQFYNRKFRFLLDLNTEILQCVLQVLKIKSRVTVTDNYCKQPSNVSDLRNLFGSKHPDIPIDNHRYTQVFESRHGFIPGLSILDLLFNLGPETLFYLLL